MPAELRNEVAEIAERRGSSMLDVVVDAVHQLRRDEWWSSVHHSLDQMSTSEARSYAAERDGLSGSTADGLDGR